MAKTFSSAFAVVVLCLAPRPAMASVVYDFSGSTLGFTFGFVYTSPDFIVPPLTVLAADLDSCDPVDEPPCIRVVFESTQFTLFSGVGSGDSIGFSGFPIGYLSTLGTLNLPFDSTFTVSGQPDAVPEPTTLAALGVGLAGIITRRWRRRA